MLLLLLATLSCLNLQATAVEEAQPGQFPFVVSLQLPDLGGHEYAELAGNKVLWQCQVWRGGGLPPLGDHHGLLRRYRGQP